VTNEAQTQDRDQEAIAKRAYELYQACGCENGHEEQHWQEAEREIYPEGAPPREDKQANAA
jgi:hypothetical protein